VSSPHAVAAPPVVAQPAGWSGTITYSYVNGVLVAAPQIGTHAVASIAARAQPAGQTVTVRQGHRYSATVTLSGFEQFADNATIQNRFEGYGFANVGVTGSGSTRLAQGMWTKPDMTVQLDSHLSNITEIA
jgi:hypothetical protein